MELNQRVGLGKLVQGTGETQLSSLLDIPFPNSEPCLTFLGPKPWHLAHKPYFLMESIFEGTQLAKNTNRPEAWEVPFEQGA